MGFYYLMADVESWGRADRACLCTECVAWVAEF